jgi:transposase
VEELAALVAQLRAADAGPREVIYAHATQLGDQAGQLRVQAAQLEAQAARIAELERRLGSDSSTSSRPPSSDLPYRKPQRRSSRTASSRKPGKQPGQPGSVMPLIVDPDETITCDPGRCTSCGTDLSDAPVLGVTRRQVTDVAPPPPPRATEYRIVTRRCTGCAARQARTAPPAAAARARYGPGCWPGRGADLRALPAGRAGRRLLRSLTGVEEVSTGFVAGVRARAAALLEQSFLPRVRDVRCQAGLLHVDETPARAAGGLEYVHVAAPE